MYFCLSRLSCRQDEIGFAKLRIKSNYWPLHYTELSFYLSWLLLLLPKLLPHMVKSFNLLTYKNLMFLKLNLMRHTQMNLVNTTLFEKYVDPKLKVSIYGSVLNSCIYISLYPCAIPTFKLDSNGFKESKCKMASQSLISAPL